MVVAVFHKRKVRPEEILHLVLLREVPDDPQLASQWNALVRQMEHPEVFYTYEWALAVQRAYASSIAPLVILAYQDDSLLGVAALATNELAGEVFFLSAPPPAYFVFFFCYPNKSTTLVGL